MNVQTAAWALARRFQSGVEGAALAMECKPDTLRKELTGAPGYKLGVGTCDMLTQAALAAGVADPLAIVNAMAANASALVVPLPQQLDADSTTFKCLADAAVEFGEFMAAVAETVADGRVTANELRGAEMKFGDLLARGQACLGHLNAMHQAAKPAALREVKAA